MDGTNNQGPVFAPIPAPVGNPVGGAVINALLGLITKGVKGNKQKVEQPEFAGPSEEVFGKDLIQGFNAYDKQSHIADSALSSRDKRYKLDNPIAVLSQGKFSGVKLTEDMVKDAVNAARKYNLDPMDMLAVMGQESTFSQSKVKKELRDLTQREMTSGWNTSEPYKPYELGRFLADKQVPGIVKKEIGNKIFYSIDDIDKVRDAISKRPGLMQQYIKKVQSTPVAQENYIDMAARYIKTKGLKNYNSGDPNYVNDVMASKALLQKDPQLMKYLKSLNIGKK